MKPVYYVLSAICISVLFGLMWDIATTPKVTPYESDLVSAFLESQNTVPSEPFHHDGCTLFPDQFLWHDLRAACLSHDIAYWYGGPLTARQKADLIFYNNLSSTGPLGPIIAPMAYTGVRMFGSTFVTRALDAHWGYGWD